MMEGNISSPMKDGEGSIVLPPRVALDHSDAKIRLDAIEKLALSMEKN